MPKSSGPPNIPKSRSLDMPVTDLYPVDLHGDPEKDFLPPPYSAAVVQPMPGVGESQK